MPDQEMGPERLTPKGLPSARRGYDRRAVELLLEEAGRAWAALQEQHRRLLDEIDRAGGLDYLARDLGSVGTEVGQVLADAQEAARGLRERARIDSAEKLAAAAAEAQRLVSEAEEQAYQVRADAWATGMELLRQAAETGRAMVEDVEAEVLIIRAGAEQEAYRLVASARRESQDVLREARFAAERAVLEARAQAEYLGPVQVAEPGPAGGEPAARQREGSGRRHRRPPEATGVQTPDVIRVIKPDQGGRPVARPGIDPGSYGDALAAEVEALWESGEVETVASVAEPPVSAAPRRAAVPRQVSPPAPAAPEALPVGPVEEPEPEADLKKGRAELPGEPPAEQVSPEEPEEVLPEEPEEVLPEEPASVEAPAVDEAGAAALPPAAPSGEETTPSESVPGRVEDLFARLRDTHRPAGRRRRGAPAMGETLPGMGETAPAGTLSTARGPAPDAVELRERLVLPVQNRALRRVKENLLELQNGALDALRVSGTWQGLEPALTALAPALDPVAEEAAEAGAQAVAAFTGGDPPAPVISSRSATLVQAMAEELAGNVASALEEAAEAGPVELAAGVSRVFRAWRGERAEHWVRTVAYAAYHDSLLAGLALAGVRSVSAVPHGLLCAECPALHGAAWDPGGDPPAGTVCPPAHPDCVCTLAPT